MTEDRNNILGILDIVQDEVCHIKRNCNGKIGSLNGGMKIRSRYLRPSLGSCHDFCKFGVENASEIKGVTEGHDLERNITSAERNKNLVVRLKSFSVSKTKKLDVPMVNGVVSARTKEETKKLDVPIINEVVSSLTTKETILSEQVSLPMKEKDLLVKHASDPKKKQKRTKGSSLRMRRCSSGEGQGEVEVRKIKEIRNSQEVSSSRRKSETKRSKEVRSSGKGKRNSLVPSTISQSPKNSLKMVSTQIADNSKNVEKVSHLSNPKNVIKPKPEQCSSLDGAERTLHSILKPNSNDETPITNKNEDVVSPPSSSSSKEKRLKRAQIRGHTAQLITFSAKWNLRHSHSKIHPTPSPPLSLRKTGLRDALLGTRIARPYTSSLASFSKHSGTSCEHGETDAENRTSDLKTEYYNRSRKGKTIGLFDKCSPGRKLTFRRGKTIDLQPEVSTPRRLKFRKRETIGDSQNGKVDTSRKTAWKKESDTAFLPLFSEKKNLRRSQYRNRIPQSRLSWSPSPKKKGTSVPLTEYGEIDHTEKQISNSEKQYKNTHKMDGTTSWKEEFDPGQKLTVLHSEDTISSPRKENFMQTEKILDDNSQNGKADVGRKHLGNKKLVYNGEDTANKKESKNLVLRHQDVEEKNSATLFNNMIKETVNKLVKTKKSKVKALVGAFETVISLQDIPNRW